MDYPWNSSRYLARMIANRPHGRRGNDMLIHCLMFVAKDAFATLDASGWGVKVATNGDTLELTDQLKKSASVPIEKFINVVSVTRLTSAAKELLAAFLSLKSLE